MHPLVDHLFRHDYGRLVAVLSRRVGMHSIESVEDAVQSAMLAAVTAWTAGGIPDNPTGWLYRVAFNHLMGTRRQAARRDQLLEVHHPTDDAARFEVPEDDAIVLSGELQDSLLRMLFLCCDASIPENSQLVFALKTLCGFEVREIAQRLFLSEDNVYKRLSRARGQLRSLPANAFELTAPMLCERLAAVQRILYVLFTEGYLSAHLDFGMRQELCDDAIRLADVVVTHPQLKTPETAALLALMHLHRARMTAREDAAGGLLLLEEQDRALFDQERIGLGLEWLAASAEGPTLSRYHAEAGIAAEHCLAPSFAQTRWDNVADLYALLETISPSALHRLNRAIAVAEWQSPQAGLAILQNVVPPAWLEGA